MAEHLLRYMHLEFFNIVRCTVSVLTTVLFASVALGNDIWPERLNDVD